jgi:hypothetical protein
MVKCDRVGCHKDATHHGKLPLSHGTMADAHFCDEHYKEGMQQGETEERSCNTCAVEPKDSYTEPCRYCVAFCNYRPKVCKK